ncbi:hypothetical protein ACQEUU_06805 [Nonomuraea sp. CA-218870]|uniref:hypothetical protein n=1 Tax=Nonomuraea sp. CA-218870 TaxID=3239998 RepID=UPI003D93EF0D
MTRRYAQPALCQARHLHRHDPDRPRHAADGINLCGECRAAFGRALAALPDLYADVLAQLPATRTAVGPPVSGSRTQPLPYNPRAGDLLSQFRHDLGWLTAFVAAERGLHAPVPSPSAQCLWLGRHVDWLAAHPDAGAFKDMVAEWTARAFNVIDPARLPVVVGPCIGALDDGPCDGMLFATVRRDGDHRRRRSTATCARSCWTRRSGTGSGSGTSGLERRWWVDQGRRQQGVTRVTAQAG